MATNSIANTDEEEDEEVDDYMSDAFIPKDNDVRPSLLYSHSQRVKHDNLLRKQITDTKPKSFYKDMESRLREEAMNTPLDHTNRGFKLLEKMGFKAPPPLQPSEPGVSSREQSVIVSKVNLASNDGTNTTSVTTTATTESLTTASTVLMTDSRKGLTAREPIRIEIKNDRKGLGSVAIRPNETNKKRQTIDDKNLEEEFRSHKRSRKQSFLMAKDLRTAQKCCKNLDIDSGLDEKLFLDQTVRPKWFWPPIAEQNSGSGDDEGIGGGGDEEEKDEDLEESIEDKLKHINEYLREKYFYCIWCSIKFNDNNDLNNNCLGETRDDHQ
ncbi:G patch domain-containing protein 11-like [Oppia nitens]|uniref:G patch domain-containing protein 11-like n=1 Tax=Oppia nitens TaxID=1686743 RepID=UPI0023DAD380|nr:G patch domain-containing protein 11-like [Oppia nitens]